MSVVCPSITAPDLHTYRGQIEKVAHFAHRLHIDLTDGSFAKGAEIDPASLWWPVGLKADFHLMYDQPFDAVKAILQHQPNMIIVHAEAKGSFETIANFCRDHGIKVGVALLPKTSPHIIENALTKVDHALIFSGNLGEYGGHADLDLLQKVKYLKEKKRELEVGWDGGINEQNIARLAEGGVDVFSVGGFIQHATDPEKAFRRLQRVADEVGST